jgi:hypothetical protein
MRQMLIKANSKDLKGARAANEEERVAASLAELDAAAVVAGAGVEGAAREAEGDGHGATAPSRKRARRE